MNSNQVTCPHCGEAQPPSQQIVGSVVSCLHCAKEFPVSRQVPVATIAVTAEPEIIKVRCQICDKKFGIKPKMSGRQLACPHCKERQKFILASEKLFSAEDAEPSIREAQPRPTEAPGPKENRATVVQGPEPVNPKMVAISDRARALLPPRYLVDESVERSALQMNGEAKSQDTKGQTQVTQDGGSGIGINTEITRIHRAGSESVSVRSLSRDQKDRRKSVRVAIIYTVSVIILITLCVWLVQSVGSVD